MVAGVSRKTFAVTALDTYRHWLEPDGIVFPEGAGIAELKAKLLDKTQGEAAIVGTAGHRLLEHLARGTTRDALGMLEPRPSIFEPSLFDVDPFGMPDPFAAQEDEEPPAPDLLTVLEHGDYVTVAVRGNDGAVHEVDLSWEIAGDEDLVVTPLLEASVEKEYPTSIGPVVGRGRIDGNDGREILDFKFTGKPDVEDLEASWQWRMYLDMTGATRFRWEVFTMRPPLKSERAWRITDKQRLLQHAYPQMNAEIKAFVDQFARTIDLYIPEYWTRNAKPATPAEGA